MGTIKTLLTGPLDGIPSTVVVIDILRATTSICAAFEAGAEEIVPLSDRDEDTLKRYRERGYLTAAEWLGEKIGGAECGNSPTEYMAMDLSGKRIAYSSTNGIGCILGSASTRRVLLGGFCNISALVKLLSDQPTDELTLRCSGWRGSVSLEDTLFAGALAKRLIDTGLYTTDDDATNMAITLWETAKDDSYGYLQRASHVQRLQKIGADKDIRFALKEDTTSKVPILADGNILKAICK